MEMLLLVGILVLNVLISIWNCYAVGTAWKDTMAVGGRFNKVVLWAAVIQSGVGFSMPVLLVLRWGLVSYLTSGTEPTLTPYEGQQMMEAVSSLWYVAVIFPVLGSGLAIWAHSLREAYLRRDFASIATAGWNSYAQIHNTISAVNNIGGALSNVGELFGSLFSGESEAKEKFALLVFLVVLLSLAVGFMIAFGLVRYFANRSQSRIEEYADTLHGRSARA